MTSNAALAGELDRRGLDYCCGGDGTLADACTDRGLDLDSTIDELRAAAVAAHVDWSVHLPKLVDFWSCQLLGEPCYERTPLRAHEPLNARTPFGGVHYQRWLDLFDAMLDDFFAGPTTQLAKRRARRMASAMRRLLDGHSAGGRRPVGIQWTQRGDR